MPTRRIYRFLDTNGDGSGTKDAIGDYSSTPTEFFIKPPKGRVYDVHRLIVCIRDFGTLDADSYGNGIVLTNGIEVKVIGGDESVLDNITDDEPIISNADWSKFCYDLDLDDFGSGDNFVRIRWTFTRAGAPLTLNGDSSQRLCFLLNDDFSDLTGHFFMVQGLDKPSDSKQ